MRCKTLLVLASPLAAGVVIAFMQWAAVGLPYLYGTCMGSANAHSNVNLPVLPAGGGFKHAGHLAFETGNNYPLPNPYVSMLQRLGLEIDRFASSTGTMRGPEPA